MLCKRYRDERVSCATMAAAPAAQRIVISSVGAVGDEANPVPASSGCALACSGASTQARYFIIVVLGRARSLSNKS